MENTIKIGDFVIVQRQKYTKLHKLKQTNTINYGNFILDLNNIIGEKYGTIFQMKHQINDINDKSNNNNNKNQFQLEKLIQLQTNKINIEQSGSDNRNIKDDDNNQQLSKTEIDEFKNQQFSSNSIVEKLIENSKTFNEKTEYSQEKYIKKKSKKYFEYIEIHKPTIRLLIQLYYRQDPTKILGLRIDNLSQILTYSNVQNKGTFLLYDSGTSGLMSAAILCKMGTNTMAHLIHVHPGNECQKSAFASMQFPQEQQNRCINVNLYSVLRHYYQQNEPNSKRLKLDDEKDKEKTPNWMRENEKACQLLNNKIDGIIVVAKEHPKNLLEEFLKFLNGNRTFVVFSIYKETLIDLYLYLKKRTDIIGIKLFDNFLRNYQILDGRTHPEVTMTNGGFLLTGFKLVE